MDYASCLEVHRLWKGDLLMIKGFLLAFDVILIVLFLVIAIYAVKVKEKGIATLMGMVSVIIALNSLFILNS
jgi:hypothetical protein